MAKIEFTIVDDWLSKRMDLSWPEKIIIAHILRYGRSKYGCFKSNGNIAKSLGFRCRASVIRIIARLEDNDWIVKRTYPCRERSLFINQEKLDDMPLMAGVKGCAKPVKSLVGGGSAALPPLNRNKKQSLLRDIYETKEERDLSLPEIRERAKPTADQFERRRQQLHKQLRRKNEEKT